MSKRSKAVEKLEGAAALGDAKTVVKRLVDDAEAREVMGRAIEASQRVYDRAAKAAKKPEKALEDKKLHKEAAEAIAALRAAARHLKEEAEAQAQAGAAKAGTSGKAKKRGGLGKLVLLAGAGGAVAMVASEGVRSKVLDALFGAEEEFEYTPPPPTASDAPGSPLSAV
jgi:phosphomevalonate kinase